MQPDSIIESAIESTGVLGLPEIIGTTLEIVEAYINKDSVILSEFEILVGESHQRSFKKIQAHLTTIKEYNYIKYHLTNNP